MTQQSPPRQKIDLHRSRLGSSAIPQVVVPSSSYGSHQSSASVVGGTSSAVINSVPVSQATNLGMDCKSPPSISGIKSTSRSFHGHHRRQSIARLLPDISKLRLLSWLVEASSELINCDIVIMDAVYAKMNRSRESSFLFLGHNGGNSNVITSLNKFNQTGLRPIQVRNQNQRFSLTNQSLVPPRRGVTAGSLRSSIVSKNNRNHHSLPPSTSGFNDALTSSNFSANRHSIIAENSSRHLDQSSSASLVNTNLISQLRSSSLTATDCDQQTMSLPPCIQAGNIHNNNNDTTINSNDFSDAGDLRANQHPQQPSTTSSDDEAEEDDDQSSTTSSSGINGGTSISLSSSASTASSIDSAAGDSNAYETTIPQQQPTPATTSSAELLSEKVRRSLVEHNYLQTLLVNVIRQYDRQRVSLDHRCGQSTHEASSGQQHQTPKEPIDLAEIAELLDDACMCLCHSQHTNEINSNEPTVSSRSSSLPTCHAAPVDSHVAPTQDQHQQPRKQQLTPSMAPIQVPARKLRHSKKATRAKDGQKQPSSRLDFMSQMSDRLCENCFEVHYWLHGCNFDLSRPIPGKSQASQSPSLNLTSTNPSELMRQQQQHDQDINASILTRNATFIRLVQQRVSSTIRESLNLIELIRKEIKCPESIKQKQLMQCFSASIQLLSSVGNYVVSAQDIPTFIPDLGQQQRASANIFRLPQSDFDDSFSLASLGAAHRSIESDYHLAQAPEVPIRRRFQQQHQNLISVRTTGNVSQSNLKADIRSTNRDVQRLQATDQFAAASDLSSSGNSSSSNSSASSSIARGDIQQSSLARLNLNRPMRSTTIPNDAKSKPSSLNMTFGTKYASLTAKPSHQINYRTDLDTDLVSKSEDSKIRFWQSPKFNFIKKLLRVKEHRLLRQQSKDRRIYNNKVQNKFRLVMMDLSHFTRSQQLLTTENGLNSMLTSMRHVLEFGLFLTVKLY